MRRLAAVLVALALVGCGGGGSGDEEGAPEPAPEGGRGGGFPVSIEHRFGSTEIAERPERIVTVGLTDHDALLALGIVPVGVRDWFGDHPSATWPWAQDELGDARPEVVGDTSTINFERIAALDPDLVLAVYAGLDEQEWSTLSQIAPTVAQPDEHVDFGVPWDEQARTIGRAVGRSAEAEEVVASVEARFEEAKAAHPDFAGASAVVATPMEGGASIYSPEDARGRFLGALGFEVPEEVADLAGSGFSADVSLERIDLVDQDVLVWIVGSVEGDAPRIAAEPLFARLPVHEEGREVFVENLDPVGGATSFQTVLSLPFLLDELVPELAAAVDGDPATSTLD